MGYKLGSISATAAKWNDRYLTAPGRLEAPFFHPKSNIHLWLKGKRNHFFGAKSQYVASLSSSLQVFDFGGHTTWQHHVYLCCGDEWVEKCWELVSPMLNESSRLRRWLWCRHATQNALMWTSIGAWKVSSCGQRFDGSKTLWFLGIKIC
jgi:hypothetical protein